MFRNSLFKYNITNSVIAQILSVLIDAGQIALKYHKSSELTIDYKSDDSPVTNADMQVSQFISQQMLNITPAIDLISEEQQTLNIPKDIFWLLDPIDGTKYYIQGLSNYSINLGLVINKVPVLGFIYHPSLAEIYYTDLQGRPIFYNTNTLQQCVCDGLDLNGLVRVIVNNYQTKLEQIEKEQMFTKINPCEYRNKISMFLNNQADLYYIEHEIKEWDTASGHAILRSLGGEIFDTAGKILQYGKPFFSNPQIIVCSPKAVQYKEIILNNNLI